MLKLEQHEVFRVAIFFYYFSFLKDHHQVWMVGGHLSRVRFLCRVIFKTTFCLIKKEVEWRSQSLCPYLKSLATCPRIIFEVGEFMLEHSTLGQITTCLKVVVFGLLGL